MARNCRYGTNQRNRGSDREGNSTLRLCCSKKIIVASYAVTLLLTLLTAVGAFFSDRDISPLVTVTSLSWGELTAATAFYFWKARTENRIKLTKAMVDDWADKYGIDAVATLASIVLND
jgi:hypothetical protein